MNQNYGTNNQKINYVVEFVKVTEIYGGEGKVKIKKKNKVRMNIKYRTLFLPACPSHNTYRTRSSREGYGVSLN